MQIPCPKMEKIMRIPKEQLRSTPYNRHMKDSHNYNIVDDLSQSLASMYTLGLLQSFPSQKKVLLNALGDFDPFDTNLVTFDHDNGEPRLPSSITFKVLVTVIKIIIHR